MEISRLFKRIMVLVIIGMVTMILSSCGTIHSITDFSEGNRSDKIKTWEQYAQNKIKYAEVVEQFYSAIIDDGLTNENCRSILTFAKEDIRKIKDIFERIETIALNIDEIISMLEQCKSNDGPWQEFYDAMIEYMGEIKIRHPKETEDLRFNHAKQFLQAISDIEYLPKEPQKSPMWDFQTLDDLETEINTFFELYTSVRNAERPIDILMRHIQDATNRKAAIFRVKQLVDRYQFPEDNEDVQNNLPQFKAYIGRQTRIIGYGYEKDALMHLALAILTGKLDINDGKAILVSSELPYKEKRTDEVYEEFKIFSELFYRVNEASDAMEAVENLKNCIEKHGFNDKTAKYTELFYIMEPPYKKFQKDPDALELFKSYINLFYTGGSPDYPYEKPPDIGSPPSYKHLLLSSAATIISFGANAFFSFIPHKRMEFDNWNKEPWRSFGPFMFRYGWYDATDFNKEEAEKYRPPWPEEPLSPQDWDKWEGRFWYRKPAVKTKIYPKSLIKDISLGMSLLSFSYFAKSIEKAGYYKRKQNFLNMLENMYKYRMKQRDEDVPLACIAIGKYYFKDGMDTFDIDKQIRDFNKALEYYLEAYKNPQMVNIYSLDTDKEVRSSIEQIKRSVKIENAKSDSRIEEIKQKIEAIAPLSNVALGEYYFKSGMDTSNIDKQIRDFNKALGYYLEAYKNPQMEGKKEEIKNSIQKVVLKYYDSLSVCERMISVYFNDTDTKKVLSYTEQIEHSVKKIEKVIPDIKTEEIMKYIETMRKKILELNLQE